MIRFAKTIPFLLALSAAARAGAPVSRPFTLPGPVVGRVVPVRPVRMPSPATPLIGHESPRAILPGRPLPLPLPLPATFPGVSLPGAGLPSADARWTIDWTGIDERYAPSRRDSRGPKPDLEGGAAAELVFEADATDAPAADALFDGAPNAPRRTLTSARP